MTGTLLASDVLAVTTDVVMAMMAIAIGLSLWRLVKGPRLPDRVVALDLIAIFVVGAMITAAIRFESPVLLQPAVALALLGFLGTVAFGQYIIKMFRS